MWKNHTGKCMLFDELSAMYGYNPEDLKTNIINYYISHGKRYIFLQKSEFKPPKL